MTTEIRAVAALGCGEGRDGTIRAGCPNDGEGAEDNRGDNERLGSVCVSCLDFASGSLHATEDNKNNERNCERCSARRASGA